MKLGAGELGAFRAAARAADGETVHFAAPPSAFSRRINRDTKGGVSTMTVLSPAALGPGGSAGCDGRGGFGPAGRAGQEAGSRVGPTGRAVIRGVGGWPGLRVCACWPCV